MHPVCSKRWGLLRWMVFIASHPSNPAKQSDVSGTTRQCRQRGSNRNSREIMPGEHAALANIPSGLSAIGAEDGGRGCGLRILPREEEAYRFALKAECM